MEGQQLLAKNLSENSFHDALDEAEESKRASSDDQQSSLNNLSNTPINFFSNNQEVQIIKKRGKNASSLSNS